MRTKLIIDADVGIGDALAVALALFEPRLEVLAVTACAGCVDGEIATQNIEAMIGVLDPPRWPRTGEAHGRRPVMDPDLLADAVHPCNMNGPDGLGNWLMPPVSRAHRTESSKVMDEIVRQYPNEVTILTLGPLTNVFCAIESDPDFLGMLGGLVCQAGAIACGGVTAVAEFNVFSDPDAARAVLCSPATKTLLPLDTTQNVVLTLPQFDRLPTEDHNPLAKFIRDVLPFAFRVAHEKAGREGVLLHEVAALCSLVEPRLFDREEMVIDVETAGELTRGMTVFDRRNHTHWRANIDVLQSADAQGVIDYLNRIVSEASK